MANRFFSPNQQFADSTGLPYANGTLAFYASGTSTPLATYSDSALTIANTNPVALDSAGRAGNIFLQNLAYKVVLSDANNNPIWTEDPVYSSDFSTRAKLLSGAGSPNGNTAGTAGSPGIGADTYWDTTNNILYVCTTTGTVSTAVWTAVNSSTAASVVPNPQGYLTLTSGTPIIASDVIAATNVYYTPYLGNLVPIYNGTSFTPTVFSELTLALSSQTANFLYDVFVFNNSGVLTLATGPTWSSSTSGACSRGTGAGTTQLALLNGIWTNASSMSAKNGATTYTIPANQGTYLGSIYIDGTGGQVTCHRTYGQSRKWGVWNAYNRVPVYLKAGDGTTSWSYTSTIRVANANTANSLATFTGLAEEITDISYYSLAGASGMTAGQIANAQVLIGYNSTSSASGKTGQQQFTDNLGTGSAALLTNLVAIYEAPPVIGINTVYALEAGTGSTAATTFFGTENNMLLVARWRA